MRKYACVLCGLVVRRMLTIAVIIDRDHGRDLDKLIVGLQNESELITHHANPWGDPAWLLTDSL
ncbi:MAG TPA: hypothetical protein VI094_16085 [Propionibacteriaceae bacterium]